MEKVLKESLSASPRFLPTWYRYDAIGSVLNDDCFLNPDYYMHRAEKDILEKHLKEIMNTYHDSDVCLIDIGCGSCLKSRKFLDGLLAVKARVTFVPIDISKENCEVILTADVTLDRQHILLAYHDRQGYAKNLNMNALERLQRDFGAQLDMEALMYECEFVVNLEPWKQSYFRAWVRALKDTHICTGIDNLTINLQKGERIYLHQGEGISHKYSIEQLKWLGKSSGLKMNYYVTDANLHVALTSFKKI